MSFTLDQEREGESMEDEHDHPEQNRDSSAPGKVRITIRLDHEILDWFRARVEAAGGGNYQTLINGALRDHIQRGGESLEELLRRVLREELGRKV